MNDPIRQFQDCWRRAQADPGLQHKGAVCVSTVDADGYPNGRFVDLKAVTDDGLVFCTYYDSKKGGEIDRHAKVALTLWWERIGCQIRVQGVAGRIGRDEAQDYWQSRTRDAQLTTLCSRQSAPLAEMDRLLAERARLDDHHAGQDIPLPDNWGGYRVRPHRIEFLSFRDDRLHLREQYTRQGEGWLRQLLQP